MNHAIETIGLTKTFTDAWGRGRVRAVEDLNLQIKTNEVFGLLGPNGSGKSTTIKMLLGLLHPTKGHSLIFGGQGSDPKINRRVGFLPEESYLYRYLSPRETLAFYGKVFGLPRSVRRERTEALLDMVGLKAVATRSVGTFSKGMARRIGLAQALINDPDLLILDEPTTGLDPIGTRQIKDLILKLVERGKTILLCSHLLADVEDVCDRIAILYGGKVQAEGKVETLLRRTDRRQITTGTLSDGTLAKVRELIGAETETCDVSSPMERLETFFVRTVAEAQQQAQGTSGAVSTTRLGEFLTGDRSEAVLDKLVSAGTATDVETPTPVPATTDVKSEEDDSRLQQLVDSDRADQRPEQVKAPGDALTSKPTPLSGAAAEEINQGLLDQLVDSGQDTAQTEPIREDKPDDDEESRHG